MRNCLYRRGFSIIEMLVVLAIVAILVSIAVPSYSRHIDKSRRSDGIVALLRVQLAQEQHRALHGAYSADLRELGFGEPVSADGHYGLSVSAANDDAWIAVATPRGVQTRDACGRLAIDARGPVYAPPYADRRCWGR